VARGKDAAAIPHIVGRLGLIFTIHRELKIRTTSFAYTTLDLVHILPTNIHADVHELVCPDPDSVSIPISQLPTQRGRARHWFPEQGQPTHATCHPPMAAGEVPHPVLLQDLG
jgi:hypothetical protein